MTNRETDGDIHGERAAEIHRLEGELRTQFENFERAWQMRGDGIDHLQSQLDACRPYLKEGETAADALARMSRLVNAVECTDFYGIKCENIDGKNWFDVRGKTKETT